MEYKSVWYRRVELYCLVLAVILQFVALSAPGWQIYVHRHAERYVGVFYETRCLKNKCETRSKHDFYHDAVETGKDMGKQERIDLDKEYHEAVKLQVYTITILATTLVTMLMQYYKLKHKDIHFPRVTGGCVMPLGISCGLMISIIIDEFLWIDYMLQVTKGDPRENHFIDVPYCVATYIASFVFMMAANCLYVVEICKLQQKTPAPPPRIVIEDDYVPPISQISKGFDNFDSNGIDNICDVKL